MKRLLSLAVMVLVSGAAWAVDPVEMLKDPAQESRAQGLGRELRCMVCQSESIEESNADLARDLRIVVREQISAGKTDDQVRSFVVDRYGDYVLLNPPFKATTLVLWLGPFGFLLAGIWAVMAFFGRRKGTGEGPKAPQPLSAEEQRKLTALLKEGQ